MNAQTFFVDSLTTASPIGFALTTQPVFSKILTTKSFTNCISDIKHATLYFPTGKSDNCSEHDPNPPNAFWPKASGNKFFLPKGVWDSSASKMKKPHVKEKVSHTVHSSLNWFLNNVNKVFECVHVAAQKKTQNSVTHPLSLFAPDRRWSFWLIWTSKSLSLSIFSKSTIWYLSRLLSG